MVERWRKKRLEREGKANIACTEFVKAPCDALAEGQLGSARRKERKIGGNIREQGTEGGSG